MGTKGEKVCMCVWSLLAQIWYGAFYIWGIDAIKFLWRSGEGGWGLELNLGSKDLGIYQKIKLGKKIFPKTTPVLKNFKK